MVSKQLRRIFGVLIVAGAVLFFGIDASQGFKYIFIDMVVIPILTWLGARVAGFKYA